MQHFVEINLKCFGRYHSHTHVHVHTHTNKHFGKYGEEQLHLKKKNCIIFFKQFKNTLRQAYLPKKQLCQKTIKLASLLKKTFLLIFLIHFVCFYGSLVGPFHVYQNFFSLSIVRGYCLLHLFIQLTYIIEVIYIYNINTQSLTLLFRLIRLIRKQE